MESVNIERGIITRLYVENFVTYDKVVVEPGRNLNLIIGPNGTGKSTIVCAIVLGLGGKPKIIGRALHIREYVKAGCSSSKIQIELKDTNGSIVITREFDISNNTTWQINGKRAATKDILQLTSSLNIQVDNLCQFLPQDKVQDFSKMNSQELLENTQRSVGDPMLFEYHAKLKSFRATQLELEQMIANKKNLLVNRTQQYDGLKEIVDSVKERKMIKKKMISLRQKKAWILYDTTRTKLIEAKKERDAVALEMKELDIQLAPLDKVLKTIKFKIRQLEEIEKQHKHEVSTRVSKIGKVVEEIQFHEERIQDIEDACQRAILREKNRNKEIADLEQQKSKLHNDFDYFVKEVGTEEKIKEHLRESGMLVEEQKNVVAKLDNQRTIFKQQEDLIKREILSQEAQLNLANLVDEERLKMLKRRSPDTYTAVLWLRENTNKFRSKIHEPILMESNVQSTKYSKYFESLIPNRDLIAFVCEDKQDMKQLILSTKQQLNLQVNAVYSDSNNHISTKPNIPLENIKQYGFEHYLASLIDAPVAVNNYLINMYRINNIPVGNDAVDQNVDNIPRKLSLFYSKNNTYSVSWSRYTNEKSVKIYRVRANGTLSVILDNDKLKTAAERLKVLQEKREYTLRDIKQIEETLRDADRKTEAYRRANAEHQSDLNKIRSLNSRILLAEQKVSQLQSERKAVEDVKESHDVEVRGVLKKQIRMYNQHNVLLEELFKCVTLCKQFSLEINMHRKTELLKEELASELRNKFQAVEQEFKALDKELMPLRDETKRLLEAALETTNGVGPQDAKFRQINNTFENLPATIDEINEELRIAQGKVYCLANNIDGESVLQTFEKVKADVESLTEEIAAKTSELEKNVQITENIRDKWLPPLSNLIERINHNFSSYFTLMNCAGEVSLVHDENPMDFAQYGLKIKVKFRDADELQELTRNRQSGGERAVTTAVYMIALQELSRVPFRCVDEINQGMDGINERRILDLIFKITERPNSSQYFLLTPKLLSAMTYIDTVTVHCIYNGPFMIPHTQFESNQYFKELDRLFRKKVPEED
ncbi:structural maintenance of chromosomes protein 5 [Cephus cinctus]|uniref:Structural maintenance of chromosomes protein 5 n=1 Tax=Cephus cinctus TaxID=211228 RepID=A0AAJ7R7F0_CEPCN|nr:structural maintenance of chromosomes protein 5 [Cephus cinctus]XP_024935694.1 structural maintenance of chromosomes protein 5 [Cephus cinctus]